MFKINFLLLPLALYGIIAGTKCQFEREVKGDNTKYVCCDKEYGGRLTFEPENTTVNSTNSSCEFAIIPHSSKYCGIVVVCFMQTNISTDGIIENMTHMPTLTCKSLISSSADFPVPTAPKVSTNTHVSTSILPTLIPTANPSPSPTLFLSSMSPSSSILNGVHIGIISASVIVVVTVVLAVLLATSLCCCLRRKKDLGTIGADLEAGETSTYQKRHEAFITPQQTGEGEGRGTLTDELIVVPFERSERNERRIDLSRGGWENILDDLEKSQSDTVMFCGLVEDEENVNEASGTYSAPLLSSALRVEEPVSVSVDDHQTPASTQELQANMRSTTISLQARQK